MLYKECFRDRVAHNMTDTTKKEGGSCCLIIFWENFPMTLL
jgi:hypothetical protein